MLPRIAETVRDLSLFAGLDEEQIYRLAGACTSKTFEAGPVVFRPEDQGSEMYLVLRGEVGLEAPGILTLSRRPNFGRPCRLRPICSDGYARLLRFGKAQPLVHIGVCCFMCTWLGLWIPSGRLAFWAGRTHLVCYRGKALVAFQNLARTFSLKW